MTRRTVHRWRTRPVRLPFPDPAAPEPLHYCAWFQQLLGAGFAVAGRDPQAVFLTQPTRSPVVRRTPSPESMSGTATHQSDCDGGAEKALEEALELLGQRRAGIAVLRAAG